MSNLFRRTSYHCSVGLSSTNIGSLLDGSVYVLDPYSFPKTKSDLVLEEPRKERDRRRTE